MVHETWVWGDMACIKCTMGPTNYESVLGEFFVEAFWRSPFNKEIKSLTRS